MNKEHIPVITDREELYDKCENMEQLYDKYYLPLLDIHYRKTYELQQENQELKKQLEEKTKIGISDHKYASKCEDKVITMENQQKEFIDWLEDWQKAIKIQHEELNDPVRKGFLKVTMDTIEEILSKYKEIIGGKDD